MAKDRAIRQEYFVLSESDAFYFRRLIERERRKDPRIGDVVGEEEFPFLTPDVHVIKIPSGGIPALVAGSPDIAGVATCDLYSSHLNVDDLEIEEITSREEPIYNIGSSVLSAGYALAIRNKFGHWLAVIGMATELVECCAQENAVRNVPYTALLGTWNPDEGIWCYDDAETVYAVDHRIGPPLAETGWKGMYQEEVSTVPAHNGKIYVLVSLDCELPPEGCNSCIGTGTGSA